MSNISKRLEKVLRSAIVKNPIIPVKTEQGILVGDILIVSTGSIKDLLQDEQVIYADIHLNTVAIKLANMLAKKQSLILADQLWRADQEYGRWFVDSQLLRNRYEQAKQAQDYDRADVLWARYIESRARTEQAKIKAEALANK